MSSTYEEQKQKEINNIDDLKKVIAQRLSLGEKTEDELQKEIPNASYDLLSKALKSLLFLKLIKKQGFPVKYSLSEELLKKLNARKDIAANDKNQIRVSILIESKSDNKKSLREGMEQIVVKLKEDKRYVVYDLEVADIVVHDDLFSTYISGEISCASLSEVFRLIYFYGVTSIDVIKPEKLQVPISDLQEALITMVDITHGYADIIFGLKKKINSLESILSKK
jgi:DNA-binding HxlR family transcriptional regulator